MILRSIGDWPLNCVRVLGHLAVVLLLSLLGSPLGFLGPLPLKLAVDSKSVHGVYVGYNEGYQNLALDPAPPGSVPPYTSAQLRVIDSPSMLTSRQLFVKISYRLGF
jgi:hypothetical protein